MSPIILALILGLISLTAITICWPSPLDREPPEDPTPHDLGQSSN